MDEKIKDVPFCVYESMASRSERTIKRLIVALIICVLLLFATNVVWLVTDINYTTEERVIDAEQRGDGNYLSGGDMYGLSEGTDYNG